MRRLLVLVLALALPLAVVACGEGETTVPMPEEMEGTVEEETVAEGDPQAGRQVWETANPSCGSCHTLEAANATGTTGPNLDETLEGRDAEYIRESIVNPDAQVAEGFQPGIMPSYGDQLSDQQIADLVAFLQEETQAG